MPLSWTEIRSRAIAFSKEWQHETSEDAEAKSFYDDFFNVFGINRRRVAAFEKAVRKADAKQGYIDLLWKGMLLIEHKSRGRDLDRAYTQAKNYFVGLQDHELPRYVLVSDFERFVLYDLDQNTQHHFDLKDFYKHIKLFGFMAGYQTRAYQEEDPVNTKAALLMGELHDKLKSIGYEGHPLELYLVRLLFCLFSDDTAIFERGIFQEFIQQNTKEDGTDLAGQLAQLFQVLNTPKDRRLRNLDDSLAQFPYVNGRLFAEQLPLASFDSAMRQTLLRCCVLDWGQISPAIFGSLFQSVMNPQERRNLGAHYTSEKNILKVIRPLFMDALWREFEAKKGNSRQVREFHGKIAKLRFLDPACGCGNFLIITYRELRLLEIEVIKAIQKNQQVLSVNDLVLVDVDQFYGIEYEEFPAQIAQVALWLIDHQMNLRVSEEFGQYYARLPLTKSATIHHGNALRTDWQSLLPNPDLRYDYIIGNPPFIGKQLQNAAQKADMEAVFRGVDGAGVLDYVAAWYLKAAQYMNLSPLPIFGGNSETRAAFVSTNSVAQGEQVGVLWNEMFKKYKIKIHFAHRTFQWNNEAKGNAAVHCIIIGFANFDTPEKYIYEYEDIKADPQELKVRNINPYLVEANDTILTKRRSPIAPVPDIVFGSMPNDGGFLIIEKEDYQEILNKEPDLQKYIRKFTGSQEYINNQERWCFWLPDADLKDLRKSEILTERIQKVRDVRSASSREATRKLAAYPTLFGENRQPESDYIIIPSVSSESRKYIPIGFMPPEVIASNLCLIIPNATLFHFGVLTSEMHNTWMRYVCGRLKSDYRYSNSIVYNNFPWPMSPTEKQLKAVQVAAQRVLEVRASFQTPSPSEEQKRGVSLADLYDPLTMPPTLVKAHQDLDKAVDGCYRAAAFMSEAKRIEYLFELYETYAAPLTAAGKLKNKHPKTN
jgi:hypothetical protein